ncbi:protein adenylyltransferase SelO family protein [Corynebacterium liangguodongii]|uniref:Protein nucleotidyltransferase YdiU n=1 Tax=Corynebacterium liangguodongii TaxID=2079535 RepID=A0A2S0WET1_9CORY|nr:protein adenylyltransferase SelO family protein [Corynebacterium liangguodongii]AWB84234.1 hypothetical protein C3E79_06875 [Corynebacterium liangguodongii]PWC00243.1 hypothetical protein DF219_03510 [Corynebacterium liangguodongii]
MHRPTLAHTFAERLPDMVAEVVPTDFPNPQVAVLNEPLAAELGIETEWLRTAEGTAWLAGSSGGHATAYAGHQFGQFVPLLGDGRALLLGDIDGREIQLKGSGRTPFSRPGSDGRGAIGPMLREHLVSEFMHAVGIPTTRSLAVVATGEHVIRQQGRVPGGILVRVATSHLRVGSVQYAATQSPALVEEVIRAAGFDTPLELLNTVVDRQLGLVAQWMRIGFVHGVMNTDNTALSGETIDYGPCAFTEDFDLSAVFSSIDTAGRYAFGNQPSIIAWNLARLAEAMFPLLDLDAAREVFASIQSRWDELWARQQESGPEVPLFLPRNRMLQDALNAAEAGGDYAPYRALLAAVTDPYNPEAGPEWMTRPEESGPFTTYCGT